MKITLNAIEQQICKDVAAARCKNNQACGTVNRRRSSLSDYEIDLDGIGAEIAFCKAHNVYPDLSVYVRNAENDTYDAVYKGHTIDVKTTRLPHGRLLAGDWKNVSRKPDYYALVTGVFPVYELRGFMRGEELLKPERLTDLGRGPTYAAEQKELINSLEWDSHLIGCLAGCRESHQNASSLEAS